ncbi:MAG: ABC transporter substrate-binding protein [Rhodospirillaceae bacterium]
MKELDFHKSRFMAGKIGRREFIGRAIALGVSVGAASSLAAEAAFAAGPKKGGHLRAGISHGSTTDSLDTATYENGFMGAVSGGTFNQLGQVKADGQIHPDVAESWDASPDAKTWTFNLRKGMTFHNGKSVEADDVIASFQHHMGKDSKSAAKSLLDQVVSIKADGKHTVVFDLSGGNADFPFVASDYHIAIKPAKDGKIDPVGKHGTGSYMIESFEPGVRATFTRNPNYHNGEVAHVDSVEMITIADVAARTNALSTGEIDMMDRADLKTVHLLKRNKNLKVETTTGFAHYTMPMRTDTPPFDNNHVRMALKHAMDREAILKTVLRGYGSVGNDHPISPANQFYASELPQRSYDIDKAKFHLKKAGLSSLNVELSAADAAFAGAVDAAVLFKEQAAKAGINIKVIREPNDGYWSNVWLKKAWCFCYWGGRPTEDWMFTTAYAADAKWNDTYWKNDRFNTLLLAGRAELDPKKRREIYVEMQSIVRDDGGAMVPLFNNYVFATAKNVEHGKMAGNWDLDGNRFMERWWFS